ncbi:MAG: ribulose-phosphate 3-epimerase [Defluviitaleaceae bacterium]|nr:ribulose-phosphate 3-epimerase [Defluviitaleaceae bacterium]
MYKLAPSLLAADFASLGTTLNIVEKAGASYIHFDVMDGKFVPNISFGVPVLSSIKRVTKLPFDVHLMVEDPLKHVEPFAKAGADIISVHLEVKEKDEDGLANCIKKIRELEKKACVAINPHTPLDQLLPYVEQVDMVLIMSVEPGFGGQSLLPFTLGKAERLANFIQQKGLTTEIEMDGGIDMTNLRKVLDAGVNVIVAGSSVFGVTDLARGVSGFLDTFASYEVRKKKKGR